MSDDQFVWAYNEATGAKDRVPRHWPGHPVIKGWRLTPRLAAKKKSAARRVSPRKPRAFGDDTTKEM